MITARPEPKIYKSLLPPVPVVRHSVFTFLFEQSTYYAHSPSAPAFIDYATGKILTRGDVKHLALKLAWGLRNTIQLHDIHSTSSPSSSSPRPTTLSAGTPRQARHAPLRRGDTVMFLSPNSLSWPIALFGYVPSLKRMFIILISSFVTRYTQMCCSGVEDHIRSFWLYSSRTFLAIPRQLPTRHFYRTRACLGGKSDVCFDRCK